MFGYISVSIITFCILLISFIIFYKNGMIKYYNRYNREDKIKEITTLVIIFVIFPSIWPVTIPIMLFLIDLFIFYKFANFLSVSIVKRY